MQQEVRGLEIVILSPCRLGLARRWMLLVRVEERESRSPASHKTKAAPNIDMIKNACSGWVAISSSSAVHNPCVVRRRLRSSWKHRFFDTSFQYPSPSGPERILRQPSGFPNLDCKLHNVPPHPSTPRCPPSRQHLRRRSQQHLGFFEQARSKVR